jgi:hypothetical protein
LAELATLVRNTRGTLGALEHPATFDRLTAPSPLQRRAFATAGSRAKIPCFK